MNNLNQIILEGTVCKIKEVHTTRSGVNYFDFCMSSTLHEDVGFFDIRAYGQLADRIIDVLAKGQTVRVIGRLKQERWKDDDGKLHSDIYSIAEHIEIKKEANYEKN